MSPVDQIDTISAADQVEPAPAAAGPAKDDARILADWTELDARDFRIAYSSVRARNSNLPKINVAVTEPIADPDGTTERMQLILALCRAARKTGMLGELCHAVAGIEEDVRGRRTEEIRWILERVGYGGRLQGVTNLGKGMGDPFIFYKLPKIVEATAYCADATGTVIGTAFLVRRDMVLTSAHVALQDETNGGVVSYPPNLRNGLQVIFPATPGGVQRASLERKALLAHGPPCITAKGELDIAAADGGTKLDFALLQLDRAIQGVDPVPIEGIKAPKLGLLSYVIGYPGNTNAAYDADIIVEHLPNAGRIVHNVNTIPGMSGSCVIGEAGVPVGLHEGDFPDLDARGRQNKDAKGVPKVKNRAVLLHSISACLEARAPNPLKAGATQVGLALYQQSLVDRLGRRGTQFADAAVRDRWQRQFALVTAPGAAQPWIVHPWFNRSGARPGMERWMTAAAKAEATDDRVLLISGPEGSGKTFSIDILSALLDTPTQDLVRLDWVEGGAAFARIADFLPDGSAFSASGTRTSDGQVKYDTIPALVEMLARVGGRDRARAPGHHPLFFAVDAGNGAGAAAEFSEWVQLIAALAAQPWARVVMCGLPADLQERIVDTLDRDVSTERVRIEEVELEHAGVKDVAAFLRRHRRLDGTRFADPEALAQAFLSPGELHLACPPLTTANAALLSIALLRDLLPIPGTSAGGTAP